MDTDNNILNSAEGSDGTLSKKQYKGFSFKERLIPAILLSLALPASTVLFGTFELYSGNMHEFQFSLMDFWGYCIILYLFISAVLFAVLVNLNGRVFDIVYAILAWISVMLMIQGNYLSRGIITGFPGDGNISDISIVQIIINAIVWASLCALFLIAVLKVKNRDIIKTVMTVLMIAVIAMPFMNFAVTSLTRDVYTPISERTDAYSPKEPKVLTSKYLTEISQNKNVIFFLVDRFDARYAESAMIEMPELFFELEGFVYYNDNISMYPRTYPSVAYMLTGKKQDFTQSRKDYFESAYANADGLKLMAENGYKVNIYTDSYYAYEDANVMEEYASNLSTVSGREVNGKLSLALNMIKGAFYFRVPFALSDVVGSDLSTPLFAKYVNLQTEYPMYDIDNRNVYYTLTGSKYSENTDSNTFSFIHMQGTHLPNLYDKDWNEIDSSHESAFDDALAVKVSMESINAYIAKMKEMGVYDDATIIITGDHAAAFSDTTEVRGPRRTALFIKRSGEHGKALTVSGKDVCQDNLWATIIDSENIATDIDFGRSIFDIGESEQIKRYYYFQRMDSGFFENIVYEIYGNSKDFSNWTVISRENIEGTVHK